MKKLAMIMAVAGLMLAATGAAQAASDVYVSTTGDDTTGDGTSGNPYATIQKGVDMVDVSGTVHVANGGYDAPSSPFVRIEKSLTLMGQSRDGVVLDGSALNTTAWAKGIHTTADNVTIKNLTVQNFGAVDYWGYGVLFRDYDSSDYYTGCTAENVKSQNNCYPMYARYNQNLTVHDCLIQNNLSDGMFISHGSSGATITDNTVLNSGDHGIWVGGTGWCGPSCPNATITGNTINGARQGGITFVASDGATISGNTITNVAGESSTTTGALSIRNGCSNVDVYENTIYNNSGTWNDYNGTGNGIGIDGTETSLNINIYHNNIYDNTGDGCHNYSDPAVEVSALCNWWGNAGGPGVGGANGVSDYVDVSTWLDGPYPGGNCVPEPATMCLLVLGGIGVLLRRKKK